MHRNGLSAPLGPRGGTWAMMRFHLAKCLLAVGSVPPCSASVCWRSLLLCAPRGQTPWRETECERRKTPFARAACHLPYVPQGGHSVRPLFCQRQVCLQPGLQQQALSWNCALLSVSCSLSTLFSGKAAHLQCNILNRTPQILSTSLKCQEIFPTPETIAAVMQNNKIQQMLQ